MDKKMIEQWARASNFYDDQISEMRGMLERFAALVAAHEREQCALIAETIVSTATQGTVIADCLGDVAAAIRARGEGAARPKD